MNPTLVDFILDAPPLAVVAVKATLLLAAAWGLHYCLARLSPRWRVALWRGVAVGLLLLPLLARYAPALRAPILPAPEPQKVIEAPDIISLPPLPEPSRIELPASPAIEVAPPAEPVRWGAWLAAGWALGAALLALRFALAQRAMRRLICAGAGAPAQIQRLFEETAARLGVRGVSLAVSGQVRSPLLHGLRRPVVLLPERMTQPAFAADLPAIFAHELTHAASGDLAWLGLIRLAQFAAWPHPLTWGMHAASAAATERACDAAAAGALEDRDAYSRSLARVALALAGRPVNSVALAMAIPDIRRRLLALRRTPTAPRRAAVRLAALAGLAILVALGALRPVQAEPKAAEEKPATETVFQLRRGEEKRWRNLTLRGIRMTEGKERRRNEGSVEFSIDTGAQVENRNIEELTSEYIDDYKITVEDVKAEPDSPGDGVARLRIQYLPAKGEPSAGPQRPSNPPGSEVVFKLKRGEEKLWRDMKLRVTHILVPQRNDAKGQGSDGSVEFTIDLGDKTENRSMQVFSTEYIGDYAVTIEDVQGAGDSGDDSARFRIKHMELAKQAADRKQAEDLKKAEEALIAETLAPMPGMLSRAYTVNAQGAHELQSIIASLLSKSRSAAQEKDRRLITARNQLVVRDTFECIAQVDDLMGNKKTVQGLSDGTLQGYVQRLRPQDLPANSPQARAFAQRVMSEIKTLLYAREGEAKAKAEGRRLWLNPELFLVMVETEANLDKVFDYLNALPELQTPVRQDLVLLKQAKARAIAQKVNEMISPPGELRQAVFKIRKGESKTVRDAQYSVLNVEAGSPYDRGDDVATIEITRDGKAERIRLRNGERVLRDNGIIVVDNLDGAAASPWMMLSLLQADSSKNVPKRANLLPGIVKVEPFEEQNGVIVRYTDYGSRAFVERLIADLDAQGAPKAADAKQAAETQALLERRLDLKVQRTTVEKLVAQLAEQMKFKYSLPPGETRKLSLTVSQWTLRDTIDLALRASDLDYEVDAQGALAFKHLLKIRTFNVPANARETMDKMYESGSLQLAVWGQPDPPAQGIRLGWDAMYGRISLHGTDVHARIVLKLIKDLEQRRTPDGALGVRIYKINEQDGPRIKLLINSTIEAGPGGPFDKDRRIFVDRDDLIVRDTQENIRKIEALLLDKKFIKSESKLETAHYSLLPRNTAAATTQTRVFASRVVEAIKVFLHSQTSDAQANAKGRSLKFDDQSLQLTIVDTPTNLARVSQYIDSLPELGLKTRQEVLFLKHAVAADLAPKLEQILKKTGGKGETTIRPFGEKNALIVRYQNPAVFQDILDLVRQYDQPMPPKGDDREARLNVENFTLAPRAGDVASKEASNFAGRVVEAIKVFLYAQPNEYQAGKEGRRLWFDPETLQLTIVDTASNLARVRQYLKSIPELQESDEFNSIIPLTHQPAGKMAAGLTRILEALEQREQTDAAAKGKPASARRIARVSEIPELRPAEGRNALFVSARTKGLFKDVQDLVAQLDKPEIPKAYQSFFDSAPAPEGALSLAHAAPGGIK